MSVRGGFVTYFILLMAIVYATLASDIIAHVSSTHDEVCYDGCKKHGRSYYYCHTKLGWDYCSPSLNLDYYGKTCKTDHLCAKHGYEYYWCYNNAGSWGYCGPVERKLTRYTSSTLKKLCLDDCTYNTRKEYFYCYTSTNGEWDYCSPVPNVSSQNEICNVDDPCGFHGEDYYWCIIGNSCGYCGLVDWENCQGKAFRKRALLADEEKRTCFVDQINNIEVNYIISENTAIATLRPNHSQRKSAEERIKTYSDGTLTENRGTMKKNHGRSDWRLDMQGLTSPGEDGQQYYNLQLQLNIPRNNAKQRTTYAIVLVPVRDSTNVKYTGEERIRDALRTSLTEKKQIKIEVRKRPR
ncbi:Hypothetical predicted protein, partial [Paramuricea clavata]